MKKAELVAPAGNLQALHAAVDNGADAVYFGLRGSTNMRARTQNFTEEELAEAVTYCHARDAKAYLAVNTLPRTDSVREFIKAIDIANRHGIDAVKIGSVGLASYVRRHYPQLQVQMSVVAGISNLESIRVFEDMGVSRVTLPPCHTFEQIRRIASQTDVGIEIFVHDRLKLNYEGRRCLLASYLYGAHANCGFCRPDSKQVSLAITEYGRAVKVDDLTLRLFDPATDKGNGPIVCPGMPQSDGLYIEGPLVLGCLCDFLLQDSDTGEEKIFRSSRLYRSEFCGLLELSTILKLGVASLKIVGRTSPAKHVGKITLAYRQAIDRYYQDPSSWRVEEEWLKLIEETVEFPLAVGLDAR